MNKCPKCGSVDTEEILSFSTEEYEHYMGKCTNQYKLFQCNKCMKVF